MKTDQCLTLTQDSRLINREFQDLLHALQKDQVMGITALAVVRLRGEKQDGSTLHYHRMVSEAIVGEGQSINRLTASFSAYYEIVQKRCPKGVVGILMEFYTREGFKVADIASI